MRTPSSLLCGLLLLPSLAAPASQDVHRVQGFPCRGSEVQILTPGPGVPPPQVECYFGYQLALTEDQLLVAVPCYDPVSGFPGTIQVFDRMAEGFVYRESIAPPTVLPGVFSFAYGMVLDGDLLYATGNADQEIIVFIFQRGLGGPGEWGLLAQILETGYAFGMDADGDTLVLSVLPPGVGYGGEQIVVRERDLGGPDTWGVSAILPAPTAPFGPTVFFGTNLRVDGDTLVAAAADSIIHTSSYYSFIYERDLGGPGAWGLEAALPSPSGYAVDLQGDLLLTAPTDVRQRDAGGPGAWGVIQTLPDCYDPQCKKGFSAYGRRLRGARVALAGEEHKNYTQFLRNVVKLYHVATSASGEHRLAPLLELEPAVQSPAPEFGGQVEMLGDTVVVSSTLWTTYGETSLHVFELEGCTVNPAPAPLPR